MLHGHSDILQLAVLVKKSCKQDKKDWIESKCAEAQEAASQNDIRSLSIRNLSNAQVLPKGLGF